MLAVITISGYFTDVDKFTNILYVTAVTVDGTKLVAIDSKSGKQTLFREVPQQVNHQCKYLILEVLNTESTETVVTSFMDSEYQRQ